MIGYITINDETNLGNRLQSYATYQLLSRYDKTECIVRNYFCEGIKRRIPWNPLRIMQKLRSKINYRMFPNVEQQSVYEESRYLNFKEFSTLIHNGEILTKDTDYVLLENKYDIFVAGSDQIWNPNLFSDMYINMLGFVKTKRKISLSSSISKDDLYIEEKHEFKKYLNSFYALSCREEKGSYLVRELTHKDCKTLIDPTLMLEKNEWASIMKKPNFHDERKEYILLYFLGGRTTEFNNEISKLSEKYNIEVIDIYDKESIYYSCGPREFLYLINNASIVLTDSFHGSVFSYIFDKPFKTFIRKDTNSMNSRLLTLSDKLKLENKMFIRDVAEIDDEAFNVQYSKEHLRYEQRRFLEYLENALN